MTLRTINLRDLLLVAGIISCLNCASGPRPDPRHTVDVRGVIRDRDGVGVRDVEVFFDPADDDRQVGRAIFTDRNGAFHIRVRPGPYAPQIVATNARVPAATLDTVWLRPPKDRLDYRYGGIKIEGRLLGPDGRPVPSGSIRAHGRYLRGYDVSMEARVTNGRYKLFGPPSNYHFDLKPAPAQLPAIQGISTLVSADTMMDFRLDGNQVTGKVVLGGESIDDAEVEVMGSADGQSHFTAHDKTQRDGTFRVYVPSGECAFRVTPRSSHAFVAPRFFNRTITAAQTIRLDMSGTAWSGTIRDKITGSPVGSVKVIATEVRSHFLCASCASDRSGRFHLVLQPGFEYVLSLSSTTTSIAPETTEPIRAGSDSTFDLHIDRQQDSH